jgi:hypothetical protein
LECEEISLGERGEKKLAGAAVEKVLALTDFSRCALHP